MLKFILMFIYTSIFDYFLFGMTAYFKGKKFKHDCSICDNWACTHNGPYQDKPFYPVRDWSKWCFKSKKE